MLVLLIILGAGAGTLMADAEIPTVTLCGLARTPRDYFDKTVRLTAVFEQWTEGQYLTDERCPLAHDDQIGVGYADTADEKQRQAIQQTTSKINSNEYAGKAVVTIVGTLHNISARHFYWYGTRFDIMSFESVRPAVVRFEGELHEGWVYRAQGTYHPNAGLTIEPRLRVPFHHAGRIDWTNPGDVDRLSPVHPSNRPAVYKPVVVFRVVSKQVVAAGSGRWNTTYTCELLRLE
jgi:hypothetical protein